MNLCTIYNLFEEIFDSRFIYLFFSEKQYSGDS